ncbi:MAG: translation initiation factor IF-3 [Acidobacteriota bacterium]
MEHTNVRVNERIRAREIRVIAEDGAQLGIMQPADALRIARERELDLVEVAPQATPPVCRILNYGKYKYQQARKAHDARKHQRNIVVKEVKFRPKIDEHDYQFKKKNCERFLTEGDKVKATIIYRGREMAHLDFGRHILDRLMNELQPNAVIEAQPKQEGRNLYAILAPKKIKETVHHAKTEKPQGRKEALQPDGERKDQAQ